MECPKCGNILDENETSCKNCGAKVKENTLNSVSKGGGTTQVPTEEEKAKVIQERQAQQQAQQQAMQAQQEYYNQQQEYMMMQQQMMQARKSNNLTLVLVVILIIIVATFGGILYFTHVKGGGTTALSEKSQPETEAEKGVEPSSTEPEAEDVDIKLGRFTITIPAYYDTTLKDNMGISKDVPNQVQLVYTIMSTISYQKVVEGSETFKQDLGSLGFSVTSYKEETYDGRKWMIFDGVLQERNAMYAVTSVDGYATFQVTIFNLGARSREDLYKELTAIVNGIKTTNNRTAQPDTTTPQSEEPVPSSPSGGNTNPSSGSTPSGSTTPTKPSSSVEA